MEIKVSSLRVCFRPYALCFRPYALSSRRSSVRRGGTQEAEGDTKSAAQGQPKKLINFSLTLCVGASNIEAFKHQGDRVIF